MTALKKMARVAGIGRGPTSPTYVPMVGALTKLSVIRENWRRRANGRLPACGPDQRRLWGKFATDRSWPAAAVRDVRRKQPLGNRGSAKVRFRHLPGRAGPGHEEP